MIRELSNQASVAAGNVASHVDPAEDHQGEAQSDLPVITNNRDIRSDRRLIRSAFRPLGIDVQDVLIIGTFTIVGSGLIKFLSVAAGFIGIPAKEGVSLVGKFRDFLFAGDLTVFDIKDLEFVSAVVGIKATGSLMLFHHEIGWKNAAWMVE